MKNIYIVIAIALSILTASGHCLASSCFTTDVNSVYGTSRTVLDACATCHVGSIEKLNPFGEDFRTQLSRGITSRDGLQNIEFIDSDGDGVSNIDEIASLSFPGDKSSVPEVFGACEEDAPALFADEPALGGFSLTDDDC